MIISSRDLNSSVPQCIATTLCITLSIAYILILIAVKKINTTVFQCFPL